VRNVALILSVLNVFAVALYGWGPSAVSLRAGPNYAGVAELYGALHLVVGVVNLFGVFVALKRWKELVHGEHTSMAVRQRWLEALKDKSG
jgi:hypothetical protein